MKLKKVFTAVAAAALALSMAVCAVAAPSGSAAGVVEHNAIATDSAGVSLQLIVEDPNATVPMTPEEDVAASEMLNSETSVGLLQVLLGNEYNANMRVTAVLNATLVGNGTPTWPIAITFNVSGITPTTNAYLLHYNTENSEWERIDTTCGYGTMTGIFTSLSPVAFVIDTTTTETVLPGGGSTGGSTDGGSADGGSTSSPKTGESNALLFVSVAMLGLGAVAVRKLSADC